MMIGIQVLYSGVLIIIGLTLHGRHAFTTAGVRLKQKFPFSNFCPGRGLKPGPRSLMAVNVTTRLRSHLIPRLLFYRPTVLRVRLFLTSIPTTCVPKGPLVNL